MTRQGAGSTLLVLATCLFDKPAFKNVIVNGLVLAEDGRKMSRGSKTTRIHAKSSTSMARTRAQAIPPQFPSRQGGRPQILETGVKEVLRTVIIPLWNATSFLATYAKIDEWKPEGNQAQPPAQASNILDKWILSKLMETIEDVRVAMDAYDLQKASNRFTSFIDNMTNWYIRRSRRRFWKSDNDGDKNEAYQTLHYAIVTLCQLAAPFIPFVTEKIYTELRTDIMPESVHLCDFPAVIPELLNPDLNRRMSDTMTAVSLGHFLRTQVSIKVITGW